MSEPFKYASAKNQQRNLDARLSELEAKEQDLTNKVLPALFKTLQNISNQLGQDITEHEEAIQALIDLIGKDKVVEAVSNNRRRAQDQAIMSEMAVFDEMVKNGMLLKTNEVTDKTIVIGTEYKEDGTPLEPLRVPLVMERVTNEELKTALVGKKVGEKVPLVNSRSFEILEVYVQNATTSSTERSSSREEFGVSESAPASEMTNNA